MSERSGTVKHSQFADARKSVSVALFEKKKTSRVNNRVEHLRSHKYNIYNRYHTYSYNKIQAQVSLRDCFKTLNVCKIDI